jgi:predicted nuclease of predicted toxin-antitoxin system
MKLLFDQNISFRIISKLKDVFPDAKQVRELGLENSTDREIWEYAKSKDYSIVTFDADFYDMSNLYGHPPRIIWLRTGNRKTSDLAKLLTDRSVIIQEFLTDNSYKDIACIEIDE